jgi:hypothetical protein
MEDDVDDHARELADQKEAALREADPEVRLPMAGALTEVRNNPPCPRFLRFHIELLHERVLALYEDHSYEPNPMREAWEFSCLLHQWLAERLDPAFILTRRRLAVFLLHCLDSWEVKDDWERLMESALQDLLDGDFQDDRLRD